MKVLLGVALFFVVVTALVWMSSLQQSSSTQGAQQSSQPKQTYPLTVRGVFYNSSTLTEGGTKVSIPYDFVDKNKLVFIDIGLSNPMKMLQYQGQNVSLSLYRGGKYVPLMIFSTPSGRIIACVRACAGGSFSFRITDAKYLACDCTCGTKWNIETLIGVAGSWAGDPPLQLPAVVTDKVEVDLTGILFGS